MVLGSPPRFSVVPNRASRRATQTLQPTDTAVPKRPPIAAAIAREGATPNATMSESESSWAPIAVD